MIQIADLNTFILENRLPPSGASQFGSVYIRYEVRALIDARNLSAVRTYRVRCTQRIVLPNPEPYNLVPRQENAFTNYPALLSSTVSFNPAPSGNWTLRLVDYNPRTLNTTIMTSASQSIGTNSSYSRQHTSGSSIAQTNSYGVNLSSGFAGEAPTGSVGADYSHSTTRTSDWSNSVGSETGTSANHGSDDSMSIKDWSSYAYLDMDNTTPTWIFGQEYPWDCIQYNYEQNDYVQLPQFVVDRLLDTSNPSQPFVNPPSQLSLFGVDFTMKAEWQIALPAVLTEQTVTLGHTIQYVQGSHRLSGSPSKPTIQAQLTPLGAPISFNSPELDLTLLGLDPIPHGGANNGAVIGFIPSKFIVPPAKDSRFKILSAPNNLQITGTGFDAPTSTSPMSTSFPDGQQVMLTIQFKLVDLDGDYALFMKHWKTNDVGCTLSFVFNGDTDNPVLRRVDALEGAGGDNNVATINLRNKDYSTIDYHDYLVPGLNTIDVTITPDATGKGAGYVLRVIAIGED